MNIKEKFKAISKGFFGTLIFIAILYLLNVLIFGCTPNNHYTVDYRPKDTHTGHVCTALIVNEVDGMSWGAINLGENATDDDGIAWNIYAKCGLRDWVNGEPIGEYNFYHFREGDIFFIVFPDGAVDLTAYLQENVEVINVNE